MLAAPNVPEAPEASVFRDGLGERHVVSEPGGELVQVLRLPEAAMALPDFEFALRERTARLAGLRHASYVRVCRVDRFRVPALRFALVSEHVPGTRLSDLLRTANQRDVVVDISAALSLVRQLLAATAMLHEYAPDVANGLIAPERLIVTPQARIAIAEQALCTAIEQLRCSPEQLWRKYRIAAEPGSGAVRFNHHTDLLGIGLVALSLILGRPLADDDFPGRLPMLLDAARERSPLGYDRPLSSPLRDWLTRALQLDPTRLFASPSEAWIAFEKASSTDPLYLSTTVAIEILLHTCGATPVQPPVSAEPSSWGRPSSSSLRPRPVSTVTPPATVRPASPVVAPVSAAPPAAARSAVAPAAATRPADAPPAAPVVAASPRPVAPAAAARPVVAPPAAPVVAASPRPAAPVAAARPAVAPPAAPVVAASPRPATPAAVAPRAAAPPAAARPAVAAAPAAPVVAPRAVAPAAAARPAVAPPAAPAAAAPRPVTPAAVAPRAVAPAVAARPIAPAVHVEPALRSVLTDPEIHTTMLPADHVVGISPSDPPDPIDWSGVADRPVAVATAHDITQLFSDADRPSPAHRASPARPAAAPVTAVPSHDVPPSVLEPASHANEAGPSTPMARPDDGETFEQWAEQTMPPTERRWVRRAAIAAAVVGVLAGGAGLTRFARPAVVVASEMGTLRVDTNPAGLQVLVDGIDHGRTPARLSVSAGAHVLEVRGGSAPRVIPITVASGLENSQYVEFAAVAQNGQLRGASGAAAVDAGSDRTLPLTTTDRAPEPRDVIPTPTGSGARAANMQAGAAPNVSAIASSGAAATPTWGWIAVTAAFPADIRVGGKVLGAAGERIRMTAGYHEIAVVNEERGYRTVRAVDVVPGRITSVSIPAPAAGLVNFNASPWAEVWIGTRRIGETPLANVSVPAGQHEVVFRHPQLGEKRQNLRVNPGGHMRLSIEMK